MSSDNDSKRNRKVSSFEFLFAVCTVPGKGICFVDKGWYGNPNSDIKLFNKVLSDFIRSINPRGSMKQKKLFLGILKSCSELIPL